MIGYGEIINGDLFNITSRLRAVDSSYYVVRNYKTKKFEIHSASQRGSTLALVIPYDKLDARAVTLARKTRIERKDILIKQAEICNQKLYKQQKDNAVKNAINKIKGVNN